MSAQPPIACDLHDHLEVACLYRYDLEVMLRDGSVTEGTAVTTRTAPDKVEYLVVEQGGERREVPMHEIARIDVSTPGARFDTLRF